MEFSRDSFAFLKELKKNNNRDWFAEHKEQYLKSQQSAKLFYEAIRENLESHDDIEKFKLFRILGHLDRHIFTRKYVDDKIFLLREFKNHQNRQIVNLLIELSVINFIYCQISSNLDKRRYFLLFSHRFGQF